MENDVKQIKKAPPRPMPPRPVPPRQVEPKLQMGEEQKNEPIVEENVNVEEPIVEENLDEVLQGGEPEAFETLEDKAVPEKAEKQTKVKEPKQVKERKPRKKLSKKAWIVIVAVVLVLGLSGGIAGLVVMNAENNKKLLTPTISVVQLFNGTVLEVEPQEKATKYEFVITDGNNKKSTFTTTTNSIELKQYLSQAGVYSVKARVYGVGGGATSDFSAEKSFVNYITLATPNIFINNMDKILEGGVEIGYKTNTNKEDDTITWEAIKNAGKYYVRYGVDSQTTNVKYLEVEAANGVVTFPLSRIYAEGTGKYLISVVAVPEGGDDCYYLESDYQKLISIEYYEKQSAPTFVVYDKQTKELRFTLNANGLYGSAFDLLINYIDGTTKEHKIYLKDANVETSGNVVTVKCNLEQVASGDITSIAIVTLSDGPYSTDSEPYIWYAN